MAARIHPEQTVSWAHEENIDIYISIVYDHEQHGTRKPSQNCESQVVSVFYNLLWIRKCRTALCHLENNEQIECNNRTLKSRLKAFGENQSVCCWDRALPHYLMIYQCSVHSCTIQSPFFFTYVLELRLRTHMCLPDLGDVTVKAVCHSFQ